MRTRPKTSWSDLAGGRVGVWGLGVEGSANVRRLAVLGVQPVLVDDRPAAGAAGAGGAGALATAAGGLEALERCEVVVKSPGISRYRPEVAQLEAAGVTVAGGLGLWLEEARRDRVVCITGTKGKSTTASIVGHLLEGLGHRALVGGNIGRPPWDPEVGDAFDWWVVETSSFQATDVASSPAVVAVTSLHPDHLDWHGDAETYFADKLSLCSQPGAALTVADATSPLLRARAAQLGAEVRWVEGPEGGDEGIGGGGATEGRSDGADREGGWWGSLGLLGPHNARNAAIARAVLEALEVPGARDEAKLASAAQGYRPLDSRLHLVASLDGVDFVDDGLSTNVLPTLAALEAFPERRVALLVGGFDRGIDYSPLAEGLARRQCETLVVTMPDNGPRIGAALGEVTAGRGGGAGAGSPVTLAGPLELEPAVARAHYWAQPDGVVLLSPAAPSFGRFADYRARSAAFAGAVRALG